MLNSVYSYLWKTVDSSLSFTQSYEAQYIKLELVVDIYNVGKGNAAIKDVGIEVKAFSTFKLFLKPSLSINESRNNDFSFNLPSNSITTMNLSLLIIRDESTELFFDKNLTLSPKSKDRLLFTVIATDIRGKKSKLEVEPVSIVTAY